MKTGIGNSLRSREIDPLLFKAGSVLTAYEEASDCVVHVIDSKGQSFDLGKTGSARPFCACGRRFPDYRVEIKAGDSSCAAVHRNAVEESRKLGSSYIYMCPMGLAFWVSPLYSGGRYAGALIAGGILGVERETVYSRMEAAGMDMGRIRETLDRIPLKNHEEIKALAQMMLICAQRISIGKAGTGNSLVEFFPGPGAVPAPVQNSLPAPGPAPARRPGNRAGKKEMAGTADKMKMSAQPSSNERLLIAALRRGDGAAGKRILQNILETLNTICPGDLRYFRCRAIELVVLLSRSCAVGKETGTLLEENNLYLRRINESADIEELSANLYRIVERMTGRFFSFQGLRHASALRRAERFIWKNYTRKVSLDEIAAASGLSAPYFSTIFREEMGEYLSAHLNRLRVEKACTMLVETSTSLNEISESCGFEDQSWFSKIFKNYTGYSPGKYREQGGINYYSQDNHRVG
jgi:AraC-like DNA-binding protein/ligand-binding sensor protein